MVDIVFLFKTPGGLISYTQVYNHLLIKFAAAI